MSDGNVTEVPVVIDGARLYVEAIGDTGEQEVLGGKVIDGLGGVTDAIRALGDQLTRAVKAIEPDQFSIEFGFEFKVEQGGLVALLVRGGGTASVTVTLEWNKKSADSPDE